MTDDYSRAVAGYFLSFEEPPSLRTSLALRQAIWRKEDLLSTSGAAVDAAWRAPSRSAVGSETVAAIIRITGGNFRLLNRLLTQMERILEVNSRREVSKAVVDAARESLVIGQA